MHATDDLAQVIQQGAAHNARRLAVEITDVLPSQLSPTESDPDLLHAAPVTTPVRRLDEAKAARELKLRW